MEFIFENLLFLVPYFWYESQILKKTKVIEFKKHKINRRIRNNGK